MNLPKKHTHRLHRGIVLRMQQEEQEQRRMTEERVQEVVLLLRTIAYVADAVAPGCFASEYIPDFRKAYGAAGAHRATVERVLEELELDDDTPPESVLAPPSPEHENDADDEDDDGEGGSGKEDKEGDEGKGAATQEQKEPEAPPPRTSAAVLAALAREKKALERVKRRSAKSLSYLSAGLVDPAVSLRTSIIRTRRAGDPPHSSGVKRMHP